MSITFIKHPRFEIDFNQFKLRNENRGLVDRVSTFACTFFSCAKNFCLAVYEVSSDTVMTLPTTFMGALSGMRPESSAAEVLFTLVMRINFWAFFTFFSFISRLCVRTASMIPFDNTAYLRKYAGDEIDVSHIRTESLTLDASNVPEETQVKSLTSLFDKIDFHDQNSIYYMKPTSNQGSLSEWLCTFVERVEKKEAFLGTPPASDRTRLNAFYQQIDSAVRLSLHKLSQDVAEFEKENNLAIEAKDPETLQQYRSVLENRSRLVIDLANAGNYCGARYMGEVMEAYSRTCEGSSLRDGLEGSLIEFLAKKRLGIAKEQIQSEMGADTHAFTNYMQHLGEVLGIPGTKNVIEHLSAKLDTDKFLRLFFKRYTINFIIDSVQDKIKKSQPFREQVVDWIKDQRGNWKPEDHLDANKMVAIIEEVRDERINLEESTLWQNVQTFKKLCAELAESPDGDIDDILAKEAAKIWLKKKFNNLGLMQRMQKINQIKIDCRRVKLNVNEEKLRLFIDRLNRVRKIRARGVYINEGTLMRVVKGKANLRECVENFLNIEVEFQFLEALNIYDLQERGLSKEFLEWLLVSHKIFQPQEGF